MKLKECMDCEYSPIFQNINTSVCRGPPIYDVQFSDAVSGGAAEEHASISLTFNRPCIFIKSLQNAQNDLNNVTLHLVCLSSQGWGWWTWCHDKQSWWWAFFVLNRIFAEFSTAEWVKYMWNCWGWLNPNELLRTTNYVLEIQPTLKRTGLMTCSFTPFLYANKWNIYSSKMTHVIVACNCQIMVK